MLADRARGAGSVGRLGAVAACPVGAQELAAGPDEHDPAVVAAEAPPPHPGDLAQRAELVEQPRLVAGDARRQDVALQDGGRDRHAGELVDDLGEPLEGGAAAQRRPGRAARPAATPCHVGQEPRERRRIDRLDLAPQPGQRAAAQQPQDLRVAPLALGAARPELAAQERPGAEQPLERVLDDADRQPPARGRLGRQERAVGPREAREQPVERADGRTEERLRDARPAAGRRPRRGSGRRPRSRSSARRRRSGPRRRAGWPPARRSQASATAAPPSIRAATSAVDQVAEPAQQVVDAASTRRRLRGRR